MKYASYAFDGPEARQIWQRKSDGTRVKVEIVSHFYGEVVYRNLATSRLGHIYMGNFHARYSLIERATS